ncbi:MAG TPA: hypothetical protein PKA82_03540 [Pyrinomonadaceae bacterium]|nr:hypothetical protein [Pyrinomonadaceae bacterium]
MISIDAELMSDANGSVAAHLSTCPNCRVARDEFAALRSQLSMLSRPALSYRDEVQVREALRSEILGERKSSIFDSPFLEWTQLRFMPVFAGTAATLLIGFALVMFLFSTMNSPSTIAGSKAPQNDRLVMTSRDRLPGSDELATIYPDEYARNRVSVAAESPSLNPQGSLVSMSNALKEVGNSPDGVVVIANVFGDGLARIEEVVSPSKSNRAMADLKKALDADLGDAPFVPASLDGRSDNMRVVLRFQQVDVSTTERRRNRK